MEYLYSLIKETDTPCPYGVCGGDGILTNVFKYNKTGNEYKSEMVCNCIHIPPKEELKKMSGIPEIFQNTSVASFETDCYKDKDTAMVAKIAAVNFIRNLKEIESLGTGLYLYSDVKGSGKTRLACSLGNAIIETRKYRVKFIRTVDVLSMIKNTYTYDNGSAKEINILESIEKTKILILDDIGAERPTDWVNEMFLNIIDYRAINKLITIFTSNVKQDDLKLDERIKSRIKSMSIEVHLPEESVRQALADEIHKQVKDILFNRSESNAK